MFVSSVEWHVPIQNLGPYQPLPYLVRAGCHSLSSLLPSNDDVCGGKVLIEVSNMPYRERYQLTGPLTTTDMIGLFPPQVLKLSRQDLQM